jgi:hypothetical protein
MVVYPDLLFANKVPIITSSSGSFHSFQEAGSGLLLRATAYGRVGERAEFPLLGCVRDCAKEGV